MIQLPNRNNPVQMAARQFLDRGAEFRVLCYYLSKRGGFFCIEIHLLGINLLNK